MSCRVRIATGRAGAPLAALLECVNSQYRAGHRVLVLVPESYTLLMEQELIDSLKLPGFFDMEVLSPSRLQRRIRETAGSSGRMPLDRLGAAMAMGQVLNDQRKELRYYSRVAHKTGLAGHMLDEIEQFRTAGLSPDDLPGLVGHASAITEAKLHDLALCWQSYEAMLGQRFADADAQARECAERLPSSTLIHDADLWVYGFDAFNRSLCALIAQCALTASSVTVTMTADQTGSDTNIFINQKHSIGRLIRLLTQAGISYTQETIPSPESNKAGALMHLEEYLFAQEPQPYDGSADAVEIHAASTPVEEANWCVATLRRWCLEGIPYGEMAVLLATDPPVTLPHALAEAGIPFHMSVKDEAARHPLCRMLIASLSAATEGWSQEDVLEAARTGFTVLTADEASLLENYAFAHGIRRKKWLSPFTYGEDAESMESLRLRLIEPMQALHDSLVEAHDATASMTAIWRYLEACGAYQRLLSLEAELVSHGLETEAARNRQVWRLILSLLDQLCVLLDGKRAAMSDLVRFVTSGINEAAVSTIPPFTDAVMIGSIGPFTARRVRALAVIGMHDGAMSPGAASLITDDERTAMTLAAGQPVGQTQIELAHMRSFDFYRTLTMPAEYLSLSWPGAALDGTPNRPAMLLDTIQQLLPQLRQTGGVSESASQLPCSESSALTSAAVQLRRFRETGRKPDAVCMAGMQRLAADPLTMPRLRRVFALMSNETPTHRLTRDEAAKLFMPAAQSISRLEAFAKCPFSHYVTYGLRPAERKDFTYQPSDRGTFYHEALKRYMAIAEGLPHWPDLTEDEIDEALDEAVKPLLDDWQGGPLEDDAIGRLQGRRLIRQVRSTAHMVTGHARKGRFVTVASEQPFGMEHGLPPLILETKDGHRVALHGKIDRIDLLDADGQRIDRVVDFKSSEHKLDEALMDAGVQLQLPLYLAAASEGYHAEPGAALYLRVQECWVSAPDDPDEANKAREAQTTFKGIMLKDEAVERASEGAGYGIRTKSGKVSSAGLLRLDREGMRQRMSKSIEVAGDLSDRIREGYMDILPAKKASGFHACTYCPNAQICMRDPHSPVYKERELSSPSRPEGQSKG